jgi:hypothetical protein
MVKFDSNSDSDYRTIVDHLRATVAALMTVVVTPGLEVDTRGLLRWLDGSAASARHHYEAKERHLRGTSDWIFENEQYQNWESSPNSFMWVYGKCKQLVSFHQKHRPYRAQLVAARLSSR